MHKTVFIGAAAVSVLFSGCFTKEIPPRNDQLHGGMIALPAPCGYSVTTVEGASPPVVQYHSLGTDGTPKFVHLTVPGSASTTVAVLWETNDNSTLATTVQYGTGGTTTGQSVDGLTFTYAVDSGPPLRMHETHLCGLLPDTTYTYRAGGTDANGKGVWSPNYTFRTAPDRAASPDAQVVFLNIGDTRDSYSTWGATLKQAYRKATPDFILFSGDSVLDGNSQSEWDAWFMAADPILASTPMIFAMGNHEFSSVNFFSQFAQPGDEQNFALDIGPAHISVANTSPLNIADLTGANAQALDTNVKAGMSAPWNLTVHHIPVWSAAAGPHPEDAVQIRMAWQPILDMYKVDADFSGHDHNYERTKPMRGNTPGLTNADGTIYIVAGSAGAPLYDNGTSFWTAYSEKTFNFAIATVRAGSMAITAYRNDGSTIESTMLTK